MKTTKLFAILLATLVATSSARAVTIDLVPVGNPGNAADTRYGFGSVAYTYNIGKYEVTAGQYTEFLNKVAATDTYGLYPAYTLITHEGAGISRSGSAGSYTYSVDPAFVNRPVNFVSFWDACRFANWLSNGQPTGAQNAGTTERGTYTLDGYNGGDGRTIQRNPGSTWAVTSEDEWYKAAYYKGGSTNAGYWDYPTSSDSLPGKDLNDTSGNNSNYGYATAGLSPYVTTVVGQFHNSASPYGTFDQAGNMWEWNEATFPTFVEQSYRGLRGGSYRSLEFFESVPHFGMLASDRHGNVPYYEENDLGFRVSYISYVPEPAAWILALLGAVGLAVGAMRRRSSGRNFIRASCK